MNNIEDKKIIFTGGGSGGHLSIMKALIDYMNVENKKFIDANLLVVGGKLGMIGDSGKSIDEKMISTWGVDYKLIRGGKLHRGYKNLNLKQLYTIVRLLFNVVLGFWDSIKIILSYKPDIIFATGGYVALPMVVIGKFFGKKVVIHEQTLTSGLTNKISGKFADKVLLSFRESAIHFPKGKVVVTGNAIRKEVMGKQLRVTGDELKNLVEVVQSSKQNKRPLLYITGGSLGAHRINEFILSNLEKLLEKYSIIWQTGDNKYHNDYKKIDERIQKLESNLKQRLYVTKFVREEIGYILDNSDLVICRPGINTLYELVVTKNKAIMIPLWVTAGNDQSVNANWFKDNYVGEIIAEDKLEYQLFSESVDQLIRREFRGREINIDGVEERIWKEILLS